MIEALKVKVHDILISINKKGRNNNTSDDVLKFRSIRRFLL